MGIENISGVQSLNAVQNSGNNKKISKSAYTGYNSVKDSVNISSKAKIRSIIQNTPEVRADKVQEAMNNIKEGNYLSRKVADKIAEKIVDMLI